MKKITSARAGYILFATAAIMSALTVVSCKQEQIALYENDPRLYFYRGEYASQQQDSIAHSFFLVPSEKKSDTLFIEVLTMGKPADIDRFVKFEQTNAGKPGATVSGIHYVAFDSPEIQSKMFVPAGKVKAKIPVVMIRANDLNNSKFRLEFKIAENEYFKPGIDKNLTFMIQTTAMAEKPENWESYWQYVFGERWSSVKMKFIIDYVGFSEFDKSVDTPYGHYLRLKANEKLFQYNKEHGELRLCEDVGKIHPNGEACPDCIEFPN